MSIRAGILIALVFVVSVQSATQILLTNDDGWAVAAIRAQNTALKSAGYDVVLSCPAINKSGTGSSTANPTVLTTPCEFNTCPVGSPATGFNASDTRLNYVNAFPVDAARFGIQTLAPKFFNGSKPQLVVSGPNVGSNLGSTVLISGTVGAASEAALEGIPALAFSAPTGSQVSYTTLTTDPNSTSSRAAVIYSALTVRLVNVLVASSAPFLPPGIALNVNYPATSTTTCSSAAAFKFVLTRINSNSSATDVTTCGTTHLPTESSVVAKSGCFTSVSVFNASTKGDVSAAIQGVVLTKLASLLTCSN
ncbi:sure-like protein [Mycena rebaudengoi]|nr:sure-like protein [Mycena rebaudengoi]